MHPQSQTVKKNNKTLHPTYLNLFFYSTFHVKLGGSYLQWGKTIAHYSINQY